MRKDPAIFCPIDFSDPSARALCWASVLARHFGNRLTVAHVDNPLLISAALAAYDTPLMGEVTRAEIEEFAASVLPAIGREASAYGMVTTCGDPTREILSIARQQRATLIVMGSRALTGWQKFFFGSTTACVLRCTEVPVLAVPPLSHGPVWPDRDGPLLDLGPVLTPVGFGWTSTDHAGAAAELARALHVPHLVTYVGPTFFQAHTGDMRRKSPPSWPSAISGSLSWVSDNREARGKHAADAPRIGCSASRAHPCSPSPRRCSGGSG